MIRLFMDNDLPAIIEMVLQNRQMRPTEIEERVKSSTTWVFEDEVLHGCAALGKVSESQHGQEVWLWVYTAPNHRRQGIGEKLWQTVKGHLEDLSVVRLYTTYRTDDGANPQLFTKHGFTPWYSAHTMRYTGPNFAEVDIKPVPYTNQMFEDYVRLTNDGFRWLRSQCDIEPIDTYPAGCNEAKTRKQLIDDSSNIFLLYEDGKAVGYTLLGSDFIDTISIDQAYQGRGFGRQLTHLSVNLLRQRGVDTVYLDVVDINVNARRLYDSLGFERIETVEFARATPADLR
ncbi:MAG: GNAT family N-acetyltransferase [Peptococcaceae bacterium]|nr:GNAT family N-acetyltransferase [Peptococcaceae bacterium]